ncbi:hypothetical protein B0H14DRAFT_3853135 [Mycena olivaceomarginata]|nr:hypothetical protein B0H14DRAFT_3853135 [Mycena olivaceomarginata]
MRPVFYRRRAPPSFDTAPPAADPSALCPSTCACVPSCPTPLWPPAVRRPFRPVPPHTGRLSVRSAPPARLPRRSLPNNCALPSRSAPFTAVGTVAAIVGRPAATALYAHLIARAPNQIPASIARPRPPLAEFPGGGVWARWIDVWVCALCMANVSAPRTTARPPAVRVPEPIATLPTHSGFPSPSATSSLNDGSGVSTPPVPALRIATATACPHQSKDAPVCRRRTIRRTTTPHTTSPQLPGCMYAPPPPQHQYHPAPHDDGGGGHHRPPCPVRRVRIARLCGPAVSLPNTCTRIDSHCASARFRRHTRPVPPSLRTRSAPCPHRFGTLLPCAPARIPSRLHPFPPPCTRPHVGTPAPAPRWTRVPARMVWAGHPAPQLRRITPTVHLVTAPCPDPPPRGHAYASLAALPAPLLSLTPPTRINFASPLPSRFPHTSPRPCVRFATTDPPCPFCPPPPHLQPALSSLSTVLRVYLLTLSNCLCPVPTGVNIYHVSQYAPQYYPIFWLTFA